MYNWEELKAIGILVLAAFVGRILFYRSLYLQGNFKERLKCRMIRWILELPVLLTVAMAAFEIVLYFELRPQTGMIVAIVLGFIGLEGLKAWLDDYLAYKGKGMKRREDDK